MQERIRRSAPTFSGHAARSLLALAGEDRHGYGIMLEVVRQSAGRYKVGPGTLYDNLKKLLKLGLVEERASSRRQQQQAS